MFLLRNKKIKFSLCTLNLSPDKGKSLISNVTTLSMYFILYLNHNGLILKLSCHKLKSQDLDAQFNCKM